jgi:hypothetical protein
MIRRLMWDFLGWNLSWGETQRVSRSELLERHPWIFSGFHNDYERNKLFTEYVQNYHAKQSAQTIQRRQTASASASAPAVAAVSQLQTQEQKSAEAIVAANQLENYSPQFESTKMTDGPQDVEQSKPSSLSRQRLSEVADELALQPHENYDVHIVSNTPTPQSLTFSIITAGRRGVATSPSSPSAHSPSLTSSSSSLIFPLVAERGGCYDGWRDSTGESRPRCFLLGV